jgi:UDP-2-acetamido-2,6-beta-L-arabino-hexul-4-ose reductase
MTAVVTGASGFVGKNLVVALRRRPDTVVVAVDRRTARAEYEASLLRAEAVFHLAGVNRPPREDDHEPGNAGITRDLCDTLRRLGRTPKVVYASSTQVERGNAYGRSKLVAEAALEAYAAQTGAQVAIFRLANVFGKWCRPHHNSVVATFCHQISRGLPVTVDDPDATVELVYVDDVVEAFLAELTAAPTTATSRPCPRGTTVTVGRIETLLLELRDVRRTLVIPDLSARFTRQLYATFLSCFERPDFAWPASPIADDRGFVAELLKSRSSGQIFVSRTRPGVTRGGHFHDSKVEKFVVVEGGARIRLRHVLSGESVHFDVTGEAPTVVDIPPGYTHDITNTGPGELVTLFWASEIFDPARPDTHREVV